MTVPPVTDAQCACNGSFSTVFNNPDDAQVTVVYEAFDSTGKSVGTSGVYTQLCPGSYTWSVTASSKSPTCNKKVVFQDSGTATIGGVGPLIKPVLSPAVQTVPVGASIKLTTSVQNSALTYTLHTPGRGNIVQQGSGTFVLEDAQADDAGQYFVDISYGDCTPVASNIVVVNIGGTCDLTIGLTPVAACGTNKPGSILLTFTGGSGRVYYSLNNQQYQGPVSSGFVISNLSPGTYTVAIRDAQNSSCKNRATATVAVATPVTPVLTATNACQGSPFSLTVIPAGQQSYTFVQLPSGAAVTQASNVLTIPQAALSDAGEYFATYLDTNGCASPESNKVQVSVFPIPVSTLAPAVQTAAPGSTLHFIAGPINTQATYVLTTPNPHRGVNGVITQIGDPNFAIPNVGQADLGAYSVVVIINGCPSDPSVPVVVNGGGNCGLSIGLTPTQACSSSQTGTIQVTFSGASGMVYYTVNGGTQMGPVSSPFTVTNLAPNSYSIMITDAVDSSCTSQASITLGTSTPQVPTLTASLPACSGGSFTVTVTPSGQSTYILTLPDGSTMMQAGNNVFTFDDASSLNNGNYTASYIDTNGCQSAVSNVVPIVVQQTPVAILQPQVQSVPLNGTASFVVLPAQANQYVLQTPTGNLIAQTSNIFTIAPTSLTSYGTYTATVTVNGCTSDPSNGVTLVQGGTCNIALSLTAVPACTTAGLGSINASFTGSSTGVVNLFVNGMSQGTVTSPFVIPNLLPGKTYVVLIEDVTNTGCTNTATIAVTTDNVPAPVLTASSACQGQPLYLSVSPSNQSSYTLTLPNQMTMTQSLNNVFTIPNATSANDGQYSAQYTTFNGCTSVPSAPLTVQVSPLPAAVTTPVAQAVPVGAPLNFVVAPAPAPAPAPADAAGNVQQSTVISQYGLNTPGRGVLVQDTGTFVLANAQSTDTGTYTGFVVQTSSAGVTVTQVGVVPTGCQSPPSPPVTAVVGGCLSISANPQPACQSAQGTTAGGVVVTVDGGQSPFTWSVVGGTSGVAQSSPFTIPNLAGNRTYTIAVQDATLCANMLSIFVPQNITPVAVLSPATQVLNPNEPLVFTASPAGATSYVLTVPNTSRGINGVITQTTPTFTLENPTSADLGNYTLVVNSNGCPSDPVVSTVTSSSCSLMVTKVTPTGSCGSSNTGSLTITVQGGTAPYTFAPCGLTMSSNSTVTINNLQAGTYNNITVVDSSNPQCTVVGPSTTIPVLAPPQVTIGGSTTVVVGGIIALTAQAPTAVSYVWSGPQGFTATTKNIRIPNVTAANAGQYTVTVTDANGCTNKATVTVSVGTAAYLTISNNSNKTLCPGDEASFVVTVVNGGASNANNLVLTDEFASCFKILSATGAGWQVQNSGSSVVAKRGSLTPGQSAQLTVKVKAQCKTKMVYNNVATVVSDATQPLSATATITIAQCCGRC